MAFHRTPQDGTPGIWIAESSMRELHPLGLPPDATLVDWMRSSPDRTSAADLTDTPPSAPEIVSFQVVPAEAKPGDTITLSWAAKGERATICPSTRFVLFTADDCWQVPLSGTTIFTIPLETGGHHSIDFVLRAHADKAADPVVWQTSVAFQCELTWFFSDEPQAGICPREAIESHAAALQFEHGTMIWIEEWDRYVILTEASPQDQVRGPVAYLQGPLDIVRDSSADANVPQGLYAPADDFGLVWRGDVTGSPGYREVLGWALAPVVGYNALFQCDDALPSGGRSWRTCYLRGPDDQVIVLDPLDRWFVWDGS